MVYSISTSSLPAAQRPPPPHYHSYLTPLLHRRFARACAVALAICYITAFLITDKSNLFWALLPFGWTAFKCLLLFFFTVLPVLLLRIAHLHVDSRASTSGIHHLRQCLGSISTYYTLFIYAVSAMIFVGVYLGSTSPRDQLQFILPGRSYERPRLNESFLYLLFFAIYGGVVQGVFHLAQDRGKLILSDTSASPRDIFKQSLARRCSNAFHITALCTATAIVAYIPVRSAIWHYTIVVSRALFWLNRSTALPPFPVGPGMFLRSGWVALLYCFLIELCGLGFTAYYVQNPFETSKLLSDKSPDPDGTLVTGLRSNKAPLTQTMAFWELRVLAHTRSDRRRQLFKDVERKPNIWEQILHECIAVLSHVELALTEATAPPPQPSVTPTQPLSQETHSQTPPSIPISQGNVFSPNTKPHRFIESVQSKVAPTPNFTPVKQIAAQSFGVTGEKFVLVSDAKARISLYLASPYGRPFRQSVQSRVAQIIPNVRVQVDAVNALTRLTLASLDEDEFGVVQNHVLHIIESFRSLLNRLEKFLEHPPCHWTEAEARRLTGTPSLPEPEKLAIALRSGIEEITAGFAPYIPEFRSK